MENCPKHAVKIWKPTVLTGHTPTVPSVDCGACVKDCPAEAREIAGEIMDVQTALDRVLADKLFLDTSGGGMTISGGRCLACPEFSRIF